MLELAEKEEITKPDNFSDADNFEEMHVNEHENDESIDEGETADKEDSEMVVSIGEESPTSEEDGRAPEWVRELRKNHRELQKRNRELEEQVKAISGAEQKPVSLGLKPTLEACDYDAERFERELEAWHNKKVEVDSQEREKKVQAEQANKAWQETLDGYSKAKANLKVKDFDDAEDIVKDILSVTQQGVILQGSKSAALLVYALGKNPKKAKELASINDPVKFAFAVANLENQLKVINRKAAPPPEKTIRGNASVSGTVDSQLERLRSEAEKTGNYTKVNAYKMQQRNKSR